MVSVFAQFPRSISSIKSSPSKRLKLQYDSAYNINGANVDLMVGQSLMFLPSPNDERTGDYGVILIYLEDGDTKCPKLSKENMYFPTKKTINPTTSYYALAGKSFVIEGCFPPESLSSEPSLILRDPDSGKKLCMWNQSFRRLGDLSIVISGYYEKIKNKEINKSYLLKEGKYVISLVDSRPVYNVPGEILECIDVSFDSIKDVINILQDQEGNLYYLWKWRVRSDLFNIERINSLGIHDMVPSTPRKLREPFLIERYGDKIAEKILNGCIELGFDDNMCRAALGWPNKRNTIDSTSGSFEQWVYDDMYLYFENGILTAIQK